MGTSTMGMMARKESWWFDLKKHGLPHKALHKRLLKKITLTSCTCQLIYEMTKCPTYTVALRKHQCHHVKKWAIKPSTEWYHSHWEVSGYACKGNQLTMANLFHGLVHLHNVMAKSVRTKLLSRKPAFLFGGPFTMSPWTRWCRVIVKTSWN